ncbi:uncharacterized protein PG998_008602 [Apiospora kogelbergensis]|uniref:uncharacterized protein n=1 Tax=Apiospora kogelbergensis TaxID=1337665 RepID=UPI00312DC760
MHLYARKPPIALQKPTLAVVKIASSSSRLGDARSTIQPSEKLGRGRRQPTGERERESESDGYDGFLALPATVATVTALPQIEVMGPDGAHATPRPAQGLGSRALLARVVLLPVATLHRLERGKSPFHSKRRMAALPWRSFRSLSNKTHRFWVLCDDDRTYEICGLPHENEALRLLCNMS